MFTGIIESMGTVVTVIENGFNKTFEIKSNLSDELKIDQSVSHNGICLTVENVKDSIHKITAIAETIKKTNIGHWQKGTLINLERCLVMNGRLDGHMVQGHIDTTAKCVNIEDVNGSWVYKFQFPSEFSTFLIEKGSISVNGISLTVFDVKKDMFSVAIIPYTYQNTNMTQVRIGDILNLEFDMIGKYINKFLNNRYNI